MPASWGYIVTQPAAVSSSAALPSVDILSIKDLAVGEDGDLELPPRLVAGVDAIVQRLRIRLRFWHGAWFLDTKQGIPYIESVLVRAPDLALVESLFRRVILGTLGISAIKEFTMALEGRRLSIDALAVVLADGSNLTLTALPFVL